MKKSSPSAVSKSLFPLLLIAVIFSALALTPLALRTRAQTGQKLAPAPGSVASDTGTDPKITYPATKKVEQVDDYFGTKVPDPYRWLENESAPEVASWVEAENQTYVLLSGKDSLPPKNQGSSYATVELSKIHSTKPSRRLFLLHKERRLAEPERVLHSKRFEWHARGFDRPE